MKQIHDRVVFEPISIKEMTKREKKRAMKSLIFFTEKRDETVKARVCANGSTQRAYISREEASSPTAASEAIITIGVIDAKQKRDVMTLDIPNAFVQTKIALDGDKIIMKIRDQLVDILLELCPGVYDDYVIDKGKHKIMYVMMLKALYGMLISSIMYYKKFRTDMESIGFEVNPYNICVAKRKYNGKQQTVTWHDDDLTASHVDSKVKDEFTEWCEETYGSKDLGDPRFYRRRCVKEIDMRYYIEGMLEEFPYAIGTNKTTPWTEKLLKVQKDAKKLEEERRSIFYTYVMKAIFLCTRARSDIDQAIAFLSSRVKDANEGDWNKLLGAQHILYLCDESYVFVHESTIRY
jgi:hypothetical protein